MVAAIEKLLPRLDQLQILERDEARAQAAGRETLSRMEALLRNPPPRRHGALEWTLVGLIAAEATAALAVIVRLL